MTTFNNLPSIFVPLVGLVFPAIAINLTGKFVFNMFLIEIPRPFKTPKN